MSFKITKFQTISRHQAKLSQTPTTIRCLSAVLKYIKDNLSSDQIVSLTQAVEQHLATLGTSAHHSNDNLVSFDVLPLIYDQFVADGLYDDDPELFSTWLLDVPTVYNEIPVNPDEFYKGLSLALVQELFQTEHNSLVDAHDGVFTEHLIEALSVNRAPHFSLTPEMFEEAAYSPFEFSVQQNLVDQLDAYLTANPPSSAIINYNLHADTLDVGLLTQDDLISFSQTMMSCGETMHDAGYIRRKQLDYYSEHLNFVLTSSMPPEYQTTLTDLRSNVNASYSKVFYLHTLMDKSNSTIEIVGDISKLAAHRTLDLVNIVGLRRSIMALSLIPYESGGIAYNRLQIAFDNYNPDYTIILADQIVSPISYRLVVSFGYGRINIAARVEDELMEYTLDTQSVYSTDPYYLFIIPRMRYRANGKIRIQKVNLFSSSFTSEQLFTQLGSR